MPVTAAKPFSPPLASAARQEAARWAAGFAVTFALFFAMARLETIGGTASPSLDIVDLPVVSLPLEAAPPPQRTPGATRADEALPALTGIELEHTGGPVKIAAVPPDLEALVPAQRIPMPALVSIGRLSANPRLQVGIEQVDVRHVYQPNEVDQRPRVVVQVAPWIWPRVYEWGPSLSVTLLIGIGADGRVENVRVLQSCGHPEFDASVAETVMNKWLFSPAIRRGRKVRCLAQEMVTLVIENRSAFGVH